MNVEDRFLKYVKFDTKSDPNNENCPSSDKQFVLANYIKEELLSIGLNDVTLDENCYVMATLPTNIKDKKVKTIGFISHMDTSPALSGENVNPQIVKNYDGKDIRLNDEFSIKVDDFPEIRNYIGQDIITTDGSTLLGADDKAGIAEIITAIEYLKNNDEIKRPNIRIGFTPDEEIGRGADKFDVKKFGADFAYTIDGGHIGELQYENFNAAYAKITVQGRNVHPGSAKDKMINAILLAIRLNDMLPKDEIPTKSEKYQGFYHICDFNGNEEQCEMYYIIRNFDRAEFESKKQYLLDCIKKLNDEFGEDRIKIQMKDQYYNMKEKIEPVMYIIDKAKTAMEKAGVKPLIIPIRGGTDGSKLSFEGLPCPNIFTGGHNFHGRYEYIPINSMRKAVDVIINIVKEFSEDE
ncbi:peptidase T [Peptoanaerobacter stomatis]|uniref:Peptidase T n=1 Tax=Peptoanaerobacter stomatis TaxID=796937 RepID=G9X2W9_9FIRM|nr:peptidase T [Peptoanaerobacter stomatis]EHL11189.1 peptidase T [Peptoanaerobacter stomatis]